MPLLGIAALATWLVAPIVGRTPFMFFYAAATGAAVIGGIWPAGISVAGSIVLVELMRSGSPDPLNWVNYAGFIAVSAIIVYLAERATRSSRRERAQREWSEVALHSIGDAVIVTDARGHVLTMNGVAEELTGWAVAEAREQPIAKVFQIVNERTRAMTESPIDRVFREGKVVGLANHTVLLARDGREIPIDDSGAPIWSESGRVVGAVLVFRDITERRDAERQRNALLENERVLRSEAESANRAKDEFLAVLSHELRTPLNAILGWAQVGQLREADTMRALEVIERNARRQTRLVDDVLDVSRIVSGKLSLEFAPVDLHQVVAAAIESVRPLIEAKGMSFEVGGGCGAVLGDADRLLQVMFNLLSNAVKFTPPGGHIAVEMSQEESTCSVTVSDTGVGIAPEFLPRVFERFRQEDTGTARRFGGLGLGLTIIKHLVEMHGGTVFAASDGSGCGASFTVRLPLAGERKPMVEPRDWVVSEMPTLAGRRALVVDDEQDARELVAELLRSAGAEVRLAASAAEAVEALADFQADVLISDVQMPGNDGYALLREIQALGYKIPAIAITAHYSAEDRIRALHAGFVHYVPKPVDPAELRLVVAKTFPLESESPSG